MSEAESEPVVVSVAGSMIVSSWDHRAVEELVPVTEFGSCWFGTWSSMVADCLWWYGTHLLTAPALGLLPESEDGP